MKLTAKNTRSLSGTVNAPPSKSYTHRAVIIGSLAGGESKIIDPLLSADTLASINSCRAIGAGIEVRDNRLDIRGVGGEPTIPGDVIDVENSGTTIRIMTAVSALCGGRVTLTGDESIQKRPMEPLLDALEQLGVETTSKNGKPPVSVSGPIKGGKCRIRGDISSQFISGLLIACPLAGNDTGIELTTELKSKPYVGMTIDTLEKFGAEIDFSGNRFKVNGSQTYTPGEYVVEGDHSSAAFILGAAALTDSEVTVKNLFGDSKQGDKKIVKILEGMGCELEVGGDYVSVHGSSRLEGVEVDLSDSPDLVPIVSVLGALADGKTTIVGVEHVRYKECDRLSAMASELTKMGANVDEFKDSLSISGVRKLKGANVGGWNDHRIVMALAVAGLRAEGETKISDAETVKISFPDFVEVMQKLGARVFQG
ncbi:MAG: 3-phosphoshikimate 1-carboxyvinyltransferase [Candidatus Altiarchaeales archaeon WOR_SM1_86-2]|nr:MAG: 3-phosphoshikimate 1-carboxyvinyltransferase [Candidatus Altiarchaeales archaeon WOR_SM1_86-2]